MQKILFTFKAPHNQFIFDTMVTKCVAIACHKHGCCVMQKCIDGASTQQRYNLVNEIISHTGIFVRNPYGNYVVQYVIELNDMAVNAAIGEQLLGSLLELGKQKYSSNVLEKCLEMNVRRVQDAMVAEMLTAPSYLDFLLD